MRWLRRREARRTCAGCCTSSCSYDSVTIVERRSKERCGVEGLNRLDRGFEVVVRGEEVVTRALCLCKPHFQARQLSHLAHLSHLSHLSHQMGVPNAT
jgi:hypothetical protein